MGGSHLLQRLPAPGWLYRVARIAGWAMGLLLVALHAAATPLDRVLIIVNDEAITESDFNAHYRQQILELKGRGRLPPEKVLRKQLTEKIILDRILVQQAKRLGIQVSEEAVDAAIEALAKRNGLTTARLLETLEQDEISTDDFRQGIRERLMIRDLIDARINNTIRVSEQEIDDFLKNRPELEGGELAYEFSRIFLELPEGAGEDERRALREEAEQILERIRSGELPFTAAARAHSSGSRAAEGGYQGWRSTDKLPDLYLQALRGMSSGEVSDVLESPNGFHILRLEGTRGSDGGSVEQYRVRHILLRPSPTLSDEDVLKRLRQLRQRIEVKGEKFEDLAALYSEDLSSRAKGGEMGWIGPGDVAPEFEEILRKLQVGEVSGPVKTRYGYHLIEVLDRRRRDAAEDLARNQARRAIHSRKAEEAYQAWLTELRDRSYVEFVDTP